MFRGLGRGSFVRLRECFVVSCERPVAWGVDHRGFFRVRDLDVGCLDVERALGWLVAVDVGFHPYFTSPKIAHCRIASAPMLS